MEEHQHARPVTNAAALRPAAGVDATARRIRDLQQRFGNKGLQRLVLDRSELSTGRAESSRRRHLLAGASARGHPIQTCGPIDISPSHGLRVLPRADGGGVWRS